MSDDSILANGLGSRIIYLLPRICYSPGSRVTAPKCLMFKYCTQYCSLQCWQEIWTKTRCRLYWLRSGYVLTKTKYIDCINICWWHACVNNYILLTNIRKSSNEIRCIRTVYGILAAKIESSQLSSTSCMWRNLFKLINRQYLCGKYLNAVTILFLHNWVQLSELKCCDRIYQVHIC